MQRGFRNDSERDRGGAITSAMQALTQHEENRHPALTTLYLHDKVPLDQVARETTTRILPLTPHCCTLGVPPGLK